MGVKNLLSATESAEFLGLKNRTEFYPVKALHDLRPRERVGNIWLYSKTDLRRIKKILEKR